MILGQMNFVIKPCTFVHQVESQYGCLIELLPFAYLFSYPNCIYLDIDKQLALNYRITSLLEYNAYTRKNIGFLYAIEHGAKVIYETDDDNSPNTGGIDFDPGLKLSYLVYTPKENSHAVNPYSHFGQSTVWPRGYPLDKIADVEPHTFKECSNQRALVQQGVVDGDPDVDAIYRLTRKDTGVKLDIQFDKKAQPVLIPKGLMSPYNCQNTLILYEAFWSLVLPQTVSFRTTDIWRSYWAQRLLWEIDGYVAFFGPNAYTERSAHSYHHDFKEEKQMYMESGDFVEFLSNWRPTSLKFEEKILELSVAMVKKGFWKEKDVWLVKAWLEDLKSIGYDVSKIEAQGSSICDSPVKTVPPKENPSAYLRAGKDLKSLV